MKQLFSHLIKDFTDNLDIAPNSRALYLRILKKFSKWVVITNRDIKTLKRADILEYKASLLRDDKSINTIDSYLAVLRLFFAYLENIGEHENIAGGIRVQNKYTGFRKTHLSKKEIALLYDSINTSNIFGLRDYAMINLMLRTGIRCIEVSRLRICDISSTDNGGSILLQRKGDDARTDRIGITLKSYDPIQTYLGYRGISNEKENVFLSHSTKGEQPLTAKSIGAIVKNYMMKAGIYSKQKTAHSLRHTCAVHLILAEVPVKEVQLLLGHRRIETTEIYLKSIEDELRLNNPAIHALDDAF